MDMEKINEQIQIIQDLVESMDADARECEQDLLAVWEWSKQLSALVERAIPNHPKFHKQASEQSDKNKKIIMKLIDLIELMDLRTETEKIQKMFDVVADILNCRIIFEKD